MYKPLVSIIIPVYNAEKYLRQCLDSLKAQTYTNWECLLIDDGSKDCSGSICDRYSENDSRFRVIHTENGGVSSARNLGIQYVEGEWIYFCDSDDEIISNGLHTLVNGISENVDMVMAGHTIVTTDCRKSLQEPKLMTSILTNESAVTRMYVYPNFDYEAYLWDKLFRAEVIKYNNIQFNTSIYFKEDSLFCILFILVSGKEIFYTTEIVYKYFMRESSAMSKTRIGIFNPKYLTAIDAHIEQIKAIRKYYPNHEVLPIAEKKLYDCYFFNKRMLEKSDLKDQLLINKYKNLVRNNISAREYYSSLIRTSIICRLINKILNNYERFCNFCRRLRHANEH